MVISNYLRGVVRFDKILAALLAFDYHALVEGILLLTKGNIISKMFPNTGMYLLLLKKKINANQSVNFCFKVISTLLLRHSSSLRYEDYGLFPFSHHNFGAQIRKIMEY